MYVHDIESGITVCNDEPVIRKENHATAYVDGRNLLGPVVGNFCMDLAIKKAREAGVGWVVANRMSKMLSFLTSVAFLYKYLVAVLNFIC